MTNENMILLVPRFMDRDVHHSEHNNARAIVQRWTTSNCVLKSFHYGEEDALVAKNSHVKLNKLWRWRFWKWSVFMLYQTRLQGVFYPDFQRYNYWGWRLRDLSGRRIPVIATLEGLVGDQALEEKITQWSGHNVYCHLVSEKILKQCMTLLHRADHIIAISPFLKEIGMKLYGDKISFLPLGIDLTVFHPENLLKKERFTVIGAGRLYENKQPNLFIELAAAFPEADFVWYGWGELLEELLREKEERGIRNVFFPGPLSSDKLAEEFRSAHLFVLPSKSEGVPKVTQEAAACGLPIIIFGFYEAPTVMNGQNGYVVWDNDQLFNRVGELIADPGKALSMGQSGSQMALEWDWDNIAPKWEAEVVKHIK